MGSNNKMAVFFFIVLCAAIIFAGSTFKDNSWNHIIQPEEGFPLGRLLPTLAWGLFAFSVIAFGAMGAVHAVVAQRYTEWKRTEPEQQELSPAERRKQDLLEDGFQEFDRISIKEDDATETLLQVFARPPAPDQKSIINRDVTLLDEDGNTSFFNYSVLFHDYAWETGSDRYFQGKHSRHLKIETALQNEYLRQGVEKAPRVVCFGLSSSELKNMTEEDNETLSDARGMNLCKALFKIGYIKYGPQTAIGVGGGYAKKKGVADPDLQRVAIVVGVKHTTREFSIEAFVLAINELIDVAGLDLEGYSRKPDEFKICDDVEPGEYLAIKDVTYCERKSEIMIPVMNEQTVSD